MNWLIDKASVICVGKMHWFGMFQILVLYCQTVKWDLTELAKDRATVVSGGVWPILLKRSIQDGGGSLAFD